jgi:hypothetical protein
MGFGRSSSDIKKGGFPLGRTVTRSTAALSKNLLQHVGAVCSRSVAPDYRMVQSRALGLLWFVFLTLLQPVVMSLRVSFHHSSSLMIGFVFSKSESPRPRHLRI